jgi:hypothetical protein
LEARAKRSGVKPAPLLSRPRLKQQDRPFYDAYYTLAAARSAGLSGPEAIPVSEILAYVNLLGISSQEERMKYMRLIQQLDLAYLAHMREKAEQNRPPGVPRP